MATAALDALRSEYANLDAEEASDTVCGYDIEGYDANFYCLDLTTTAVIRGFRTRQATCLLFFQAEDRDFQRLDRVFLAITTSLLGDYPRAETSQPYRQPPSSADR